MKHIIVIETPDDPELMLSQKMEFEKTCTKIVEILALNYYDIVVVRSDFFKESAIKAVAALYGITYNPTHGEFK